MSDKKSKFNAISFIASDVPAATRAAERLIDRYGNVALEEAGAIVALGGDGLMLQTLHKVMSRDIPIYGMNCGSVGFLMNEYDEDNLPEKLQSAEISIIHPLSMTVTERNGQTASALAINEVSLFRQRYQAAKLQISVDEKIRLPELICDGVLLSTPAGSTAYNLSAHGPILPLNAPLLALTPISPFRPRRWRGALLPNSAKVEIKVVESDKRPVSAVADHTEIDFVERVLIKQDTDISLQLMFDPGHALDERILSEQFLY